MNNPRSLEKVGALKRLWQALRRFDDVMETTQIQIVSERLLRLEREVAQIKAQRLVRPSVAED